MLKKIENEPFDENCWWCGESWPIGVARCTNCGNTARVKPALDWDHIQKVFPKGVPSCGETDAALLGASSDDSPASGTIFLNT